MDVTGLRAGSQRNHGSVSDRDKIFLSASKLQDRFGNPKELLFVGHREFFLRV
jgi:hypothetical protein